MNPAPGAPNYPIASLCVSDLAADVTEAMLFEKFSTVGAVLSIRVCRDIVTRRSLGYAYVNFQQPAAAEKALDTMSYLIIRGRPCRITWSQRDPSLRKSGVGNILIKNLDKSIDNKALYDTFWAFGNILSCKIAQDEEGNSKGYGFVDFHTEEAAENAIRKVNGMLLNGKKVFVTKRMSQRERQEQLGNQPKKFTNVYVKNFGEEMTEADLREFVHPFGKVLSLKVVTSDQGRSKGFGFVSFETPEEAQQAVEELSGKDWNGQKLYAARAQKRAERQMDLKSQFEKRKIECINRYQGVNLYAKNVDDTIDDTHLREEFSAYGTITSAKVMTDNKNNSQAQRSLKMNPAPGAPNYPIACLCVGDLASDVTEAMLFEKFSTVGAVLSIRVCRDIVTRCSLGYAYVNFQQPAAAEKALDTMNFSLIRGRPCRITWSQRDPSLRKSGVGNIFIKNLDKSIDNKALYDTFSAFGNILSCKIAQDEEGNSKGYGFVHFDTEEAAENAIRKMNGMLLNDKKVFVTEWMSQKERLEQLGNQPKKFTNVYVKNFGEEMTEADLRELVHPFGKVLSLKVAMSDQGHSVGFGFVSFETPEEAQQAVEELSGMVWNGRKLYAARAQKRAERQMDLKSQFEKRKIERINRYQGVNLYVKNLDDTIDDARLREEFSAYGTITSAKVMMDRKNNSKGFGFVCFSSPKEATKAVTEMNGRILMSKRLYVALAQHKEDRKAQLTAQHMQRIAGLRMQQAAGQRVGQVFPQAGAFYIQPLAQAGQRPFFIPQMQQVRPRWQPMHSLQQVRPRGMQGMPGAGQVPRARGIRQVPPRGVPGQRQPGGAGGPSKRVGGMAQAQVRGPGAMQGQGLRPAFKFQQNVRNQPAQGHPGAVPMQPQEQVPQTIQIPGQDPLNPSLLAAASLQDQKQMLGERLFPMIQAMHPDQAGKITGMLLEIDNTELLHMLESREALAAKTQEAVSVLRAHSAKKKSTEIKN